MIFRSHPDDFCANNLKIMFTVSWMKGTAQHWFEPNLELEEDELPNFTVSWYNFEDALKATFSEPDPVASATTNLENLVMHDHHHLNKYNIDFNEYSSLSGFNECALYTRYYKGLVPRLKDTLVFSGHPVMLAQLRH